MNADRWRSIAAAAASRWGSAYGVFIPTELVLAIIQVESSGVPTAIRKEPDGRVSRGLMQVLDDTARQMGYFNPADNMTPAGGVDVGVKYLGWQIKRYNGDLKRAVAAYNAGTARYKNDNTFVNQGYVDRVYGYWKRQASSPIAGVVGAIVVALAAITASIRSKIQR